MSWGKLKSVLFMASADPLGTNPFHDCQIFKVSALGRHLRQLTRFGEGVPATDPCGEVADERPGCGIRLGNWASPHSMALYSDCDPFGTNPDGSQVFAIDYQGSRLRQLTPTAGLRQDADGTLEVELPGPVAAGP
jgi:hypothetical protein